MAILAMDQYAELLRALCPRAEIARDPSELEGLLQKGKLPILAPFSWLRARDPLPHDWDVTSDSISAWVAKEVGAHRLVLVKSVEGVMAPEGLSENAPAELAAELGFVDDYFTAACPKSLECWMVSGDYPERVVELLKSGRTRGTRLAS
jgi:aspartokinase-like uncharacterized kinase